MKSAKTKNDPSWKWVKSVFSDSNLMRARIFSGFVLFFYVFFHFINHALGLISLDAIEAMAEGFEDFWRLPPMSALLYGSLTVHFFASLLRVYQRRTMRMPPREWMQLILGIAIPFLLVVHVMGTRYANVQYDIHPSYTYVLLSTFVFSPISGWLNAAGLVAAWVHGCIGLHMWAKVKPWYSRAIHETGVVIAAVLPCFSLAGYLAAGRAIIPKASDGEFMGAYYEDLNLSGDHIWGLIAQDTEVTRNVLFAIVIGVMLLRLLRNISIERKGEVLIDFVDGPKLKQVIGPTLLEMSKLGGVPHASVCGGRGRCSTCRVRILTDAPDIDPADDAERKVLARLRAPDDVRLACQINPRSDLQVMRLLPSDATMANAADAKPWSTGRERVVAVMFADLREFTRTSESRLPFDVVYLINQFSRAMGQAVEQHDGRIDKFLGDGFMALFGVEGSPEEGARQSLAAAEAMIMELDALNERLAGDLDEPLRMGIGIHAGSVILGDMGYGNARGLTAIGDTVNTASRLEAATKTVKSKLCVSAETVKLAGLQVAKKFAHEITVRGKKNKLAVYALDELETVNSRPVANGSVTRKKNRSLS